MDVMNHSLTFGQSLGLTGTIIGQTAYYIYRFLCGREALLELNEIHMRLSSLDEFHHIRNGSLNHIFSLRKISNCKLQLTFKANSVIKFFVFQPMYGQIGFEEFTSSEVEVMLNSNLEKVRIENILNAEMSVLLEPLLNLRDCKGIDEAFFNWTLNKKFNEIGYIDHKQLSQLKLEYSLDNLKRSVALFLSISNIRRFVPEKFVKKVRKVINFLYSKKVVKRQEDFKVQSYADFLEVITSINKYFVDKVRRNQSSYEINLLFIDFPIKLFGKKEDFLHESKRKSLFLVRKNEDDIHFKSLAILDNLRWFFNTRYNATKSLGFDGEYGRAINGYGQTFHKYDDVMLWLKTHPHTIEEVEYVILDPIPPNYIHDPPRA